MVVSAVGVVVSEVVGGANGEACGVVVSAVGVVVSKAVGGAGG